MSLDRRTTRAQILVIRRRVTELLAQLDADQVEQTPESQAWAALADAHQQLSLALAFVDATERPEPTAQELGAHGLRLVR